MRIAFVIYGPPEQVSGGYLYDRMIMEGLRSLGAEVDFVSLPERGYLPDLAENLFRAPPETLRKMEPDVLMEDELCHPSLWHLNRRLKATLGCPVVSVVHHLRSSEAHPDLWMRLYRRVERMYLQTVDGFICNSHATCATVRGLLGEERPSVVAYPGGDHVSCSLDEAGLQEHCLTKGPLRVLFVGNVIPRKGLDTLIHALKRLPRQGWRLTAAGSLSADLHYTQRIRRLVAAAGLEDHVRLTGPIDDAALAELFSTHHCLAVPSLYEGFGIVYLEAMAHGLPVIASTAGAIPEVVADGIEGFLVGSGDVATLAGRLEALIRDREALLAMGRAARRRYNRHPTWLESAERIHAFLQGMIRLGTLPAGKGKGSHVKTHGV